MIYTQHKYDLGDWVRFKSGDRKDDTGIISEVVARCFEFDVPAYRLCGDDQTLYPETIFAKIRTANWEGRREWEGHYTRARK